MTETAWPKPPPRQRVGIARKLVDRLAHRLGYVRWSYTIQGDICFKTEEEPFIDLRIPGGYRVTGTVHYTPSNTRSE